eukprot:88307_1
MSATNAMSVVAIKVELKRRDRDPVFHRFSGTYSYSELSTVISHLWGERPKHLVLDYTDDEGDQVRFTSQSEWEECVRIHQGSGASVLHLTGKRAKDLKGSKRTKRAQAEAEADSSSESEAEVDIADVSVVEDAHLQEEKKEVRRPTTATSSASSRSVVASAVPV